MTIRNSSPPRRPTVSDSRISLPRRQRHLAEDAIAGLMAERVVDVLEAVEIDEQDGQPGLVAVRTLQCLVQPVAQQQAVGQAGQRVVVCLVVELSCASAQLGDVGEYPDIVGDAGPPRP
jgi:hypothetical protein